MKTRKEMMSRRRMLIGSIRFIKNNKKDEITELKDRIDFYIKFSKRDCFYDDIVAETIDDLRTELTEKINESRRLKLSKLKEYELNDK